jgi:hypothetical protein
MTDITERLRLRNDPSQMLMCYPPRPAPDMLCYEAAAEIERLRDALHEWDALIRHQYSGSQEAMSDMTYAAQRTAHLLHGDEPWPEPRRAALGEASDDAAT